MSSKAGRAPDPVPPTDAVLMGIWQVLAAEHGWESLSWGAEAWVPSIAAATGAIEERVRRIGHQLGYVQPNPHEDPEEWLTSTAVADLLGITTRQVAAWAYRRNVERDGDRTGMRYRRADVVRMAARDNVDACR